MPSAAHRDARLRERFFGQALGRAIKSENCKRRTTARLNLGALLLVLGWSNPQPRNPYSEAGRPACREREHG